MTMLSPSRAEEALHYVVQQFTQWRRLSIHNVLVAW